MGSKTSKTAASPTKVTPVYYTPSVEVRKKFNEEHFGEVTLVTDKDTRRDMYLKELTLTTKEAFDAELTLCEKRTDYANENVVRMIGYNHKSESKMCSSLFKINIFLEVITKTLADLLKDAEQTNRPFDEIELLYLAENLISCLAYFQTHGIHHGDIRPVNVFAAETVYKLADPSLTILKNSSALILALAGEKVLLAPEVLRLLPARDFKSTYDKFRADVFSVGATLLSVATLTRSEDLYNYEKGTINETLIKERLEKVRLNFSDFTYTLIKDMLVVDEWKRPDFVQLETKIAPFQKAMRQRQSISPRVDFNLDDDILQRAAIQIARSQELRANLAQQDKPYYNGGIVV